LFPDFSRQRSALISFNSLNAQNEPWTHTILEDGTKMLHRNVSNRLPGGAVYPSTKDTSDWRYSLSVLI